MFLFNLKKTPFIKLLIPAIFLVIYTTGCENGDEATTESSAISITVTEAETRDLSSAFTVSSEVVAYNRSYVASRLSGLVEQVYREEGQTVRRGDTLAELDVRQQQIDLRRAQAELREAEDIFDRTSILYETDAATRAELLTAERNLEQIQSDIENLELTIGYGTVRSPIDGVITARLVEPGNNVSVNERMFTVTDMDLLVVRPGVSELNLRDLEEGQSTEVMLDVYPDRVFSGEIRRIFPSVDTVTRLFTVEVELVQDEDKPVIRPGYLARVRFTADDRRDVLTVPSEAVTERDGDPIVFVLNDDQSEARRTPVEIGIQRDGYAEIISGLNSGDKVAAANLDALEDGSAVRNVGTFRRFGFRN